MSEAAAWQARRWASAAIALVQSLVILGPALGRGVTVVYDMAWSPDPRWTPFVLGLDTPAPRAVPSDAVAVLLGRILTAPVAQALVLLSILMTLALGVGVLVRTIDPRTGLVAEVAAMTAVLWNPFVYERLVIGQWTIVLGLAALPLTLAAALRVRRGEGGLIRLLGWLAVAGIGGANTLAMSVLSVLAVLVTGRGTPRVRIRDVGLTVVVCAGLSAAWALPALTAGARSAVGGSRAFVPTADTPLGVVGSLVSGGGVWNVAAHPAARQVWLIAVVAAALALAGIGGALVGASRGDRVGLISAVGVPGIVVLLSVIPGLDTIWTQLVTVLPGGGILRDAQKFVAAWVVVAAAGLGLIVHRLLRMRWSPRGPLVALLVVAPVALLPVLAWGALGRLESRPVPPDFRHAVTELNALPPGDVGVLPWTQYRRYDWNGQRVSLTLLPRMVDRVTVYDDSLPLRAGTVPGESARAANVTDAISGGASAVQALTEEADVRYVALERRAGSSDEEIVTEVREAGDIVVDSDRLLVVEVDPEAAHDHGTRGTTVLAWILTTVTAGAVLVTIVGTRLRRPRVMAGEL